MAPGAASIIRLGTRGSLLALRQSAVVSEELQRRHPGLRIEQIIIKTSGDQILDRPLYELGGKGLFVKEIELALIDGQIDFAVHSYKDLPVTMPLVESGKLVVAATPLRHDPRDLLICRAAAAIDELPHGARIGTSSLRRKSQILHRREDLQIVPLRGNIDTRIKKWRAGEIDAVVLALAGIDRAGLMDADMHAIDSEIVLPAAGQGALALQCRKDDARTREILESVHDPATQNCVEMERATVRKLNGDCHSPIAVLAELDGASVRLRAVVGARDGGKQLISAGASGDAGKSRAIIERVGNELLRLGAERLLGGGAA